MPYLNEDEIVISGRTVSSIASEVDDGVDESYFDNKVNKLQIFVMVWVLIHVVVHRNLGSFMCN